MVRIVKVEDEVGRIDVFELVGVEPGDDCKKRGDAVENRGASFMAPKRALGFGIMRRRRRAVGAVGCAAIRSRIAGRAGLCCSPGLGRWGTGFRRYDYLTPCWVVRGLVRSEL
jgi:hypothetical protein